MRVSVITPTYGWHQHLHHLLRCFERQTHVDKELLLLDDSPEPCTWLAALGNPRVRYVHVSERLTVGAKRNLLGSWATGELIAHFDHDDYYAPEYLEHMVGKLGDADLLTLDGWFAYDTHRRAFFYWQTGELLPVHYLATADGLRAVDPTAQPGRADWRRRNLYGYGFSYLYRRELLATTRFPEDPRHDEDYAFVEAIERCGARVAFADDHTGLLLHLTHRHGISAIVPNYLLPSFLLPRLFGDDVVRYLDEAFGQPGAGAIDHSTTERPL